MKYITLIFIFLVSSLHANKMTSIYSKNYSLLDFGAKGDGKNDDSQAMKLALETISKTVSKTLTIPNDYDFNLGKKLIDLEISILVLHLFLKEV